MKIIKRVCKNQYGEIIQLRLKNNVIEIKHSDAEDKVFQPLNIWLSKNLIDLEEFGIVLSTVSSIYASIADKTNQSLINALNGKSAS